MRFPSYLDRQSDEGEIGRVFRGEDVFVQRPDAVLVVHGELVQVQEREVVTVPCAVEDHVCCHRCTFSEAHLAIVLDAVHLIDDLTSAC